jgi:hypothetical protein
VSLVGDDECVSLLGARHAFKLSELRVVVWFGSVDQVEERMAVFVLVVY